MVAIIHQLMRESSQDRSASLCRRRLGLRYGKKQGHKVDRRERNGESLNLHTIFYNTRDALGPLDITTLQPPTQGLAPQGRDSLRSYMVSVYDPITFTC